ncbi:hypothetical protein K6V98_08015 [Collinsella sp. AGMB00827]|uniref:HTH marR-type domain-containing protein n=1 Tax=Collinsella ureilytica TaxID=2869515 RepID=A0ABS7MLQ5_9ACTN|nr:hypothetical protein [Collinsella urealyticum]
MVEQSDAVAEIEASTVVAGASDEKASSDFREATDIEPLPSQQQLNDELISRIKRAENLLFRRRIALERAAEEQAGRVNELTRAIKLLDLKPKMEQKEMADLLGMRLRELDALLAQAEQADLVGRIEPSEPDMRKVVVFASEDAEDRASEIVKKDEPLVPGLSAEDLQALFDQLDKVVNPLVELGLEEDRGRGDRDDRRGGRGGRREDGDRSHGKFGAPRMGFGGSRGGHSDRGGRGGFGGRSRDDRGGRGGFGGRGRDDRGSRGGFGDRDRGGRGGFGGRGRDDRGGRGGFGGRGRDDRGSRGGFGGRDRY